nr:thiolase family protein [uncultured Methanobacterium sp.]
MNEVVIVSCARTPLGKFGGSLKDFSATQLGGFVVKEAVKRADIDPNNIKEVVMGNVISAGLGQNVARQAAINADLPSHVGAYHVDEVCGSSLRSVILATQSIKVGDSQVVVAGGMESMNNCPYLLNKARFGYRLFDGKLIDSLVTDGLWDVFNDYHMGMTGELIAEKYDISREDCDKFSLWSHKKADEATNSDKFLNEIIPVEVKSRKGNYIFDKDEGIRENTSLEKLAKLKPAFKEDGVITAGNSSQITDGAAAIVLMEKTKAEKTGLEPLVQIKGYETCSVKPENAMEAPIPCTKNLLNKLNLDVSDIDLIEHNEAFSSASVALMNELDIEKNIFNVNGGAVALGHPIGASGARILVTLIHEMVRDEKERGVATICIGGGSAISMVLENI